MNLRWCWDPRSQDLFRWADPEVWESAGGDPMRLLGMIGKERLEALSRDRSFLAFLHEAKPTLHHHLGRTVGSRIGPTWRCRRLPISHPSSGSTPRFPSTRGASACWPATTSRRRGASGLPLIGVRAVLQARVLPAELNVEGWQVERYPSLDPAEMALESVGRGRRSCRHAGRRTDPQGTSGQDPAVPPRTPT